MELHSIQMLSLRFLLPELSRKPNALFILAEAMVAPGASLCGFRSGDWEVCELDIEHLRLGSEACLQEQARPVRRPIYHAIASRENIMAHTECLPKRAAHPRQGSRFIAAFTMGQRVLSAYSMTSRAHACYFTISRAAHGLTRAHEPAAADMLKWTRLSAMGHAVFSLKC